MLKQKKGGRALKILFLTPGIVNYNCDINFYEPLKKFCESTQSFDYKKEEAKYGQKVMNKNLLQLIKNEKPEYILWHTGRHEILLKTLRLIRENGTKIIAWFSDDQWRFDSYSKKLINHIDFAITTDEQAIEKYKQLGVRVIHCQWAANQRFYKQIPLRLEYDVTFLGQCYGDRKDYIKAIKKAGIALHLFGKVSGHYLKFEETIKIFNQSKINLNFSSSSQGSHIKQIKARVFEITISSGFLLTEYAPYLENYFKMGKEIVCFSTSDEAIDKIKYYLTHEEDRLEIARAGYKAALTRHTWDKRIEGIFTEIEKIELQNKIELNLKYKSKMYICEIKESLVIKFKFFFIFFHWFKNLPLRGMSFLFKKLIEMRNSRSNYND